MLPYKLGFRHLPVAEDWPVLAVKWLSFALRPTHFFDRNPAIDLASAPN